MDSDTDDEREATTNILLERRRALTQTLRESPYDLVTYVERALVHSDLGYPDLAAGDSYRALLLCDAIRGEEEYGEQAEETLLERAADGLPALLKRANRHGTSLSNEIHALDLENTAQTALQLAEIASIRCYRSLAISLLLCGCLKSAYGFCIRGLESAPNDEDLLQAKEYITRIGQQRLKVDRIDINDLPDQGLVRREIYPWNNHEPDRFADQTLEFLNKELRAIGAKCEVKAVELPVLHDNTSIKSFGSGSSTSKQLGLFATEDIAPGDTVLLERTLLAANNRLKEGFCDACSTEFPPLDAPDSTVVSCEECIDIAFCSPVCHDLAQEAYHPAACDKDLDTIAKDPTPAEKTSALYLLLLTRALTLAETQEVHPLDLKETKYIYGDFLPPARNAIPLSPSAPPPPIWTLPFSFNTNIAAPLHVLEKMDIDIFAEVERYDLWVFNTCYAKFRGTASARVNHKTGHPEVAAVHPLWCLANHDCDPNVQWEWAGEMRLWVREERKPDADGKVLRGGIRKGEEIFNHYCDIDLPVQERREWAKGSLGGLCMCARCKREAAAEEDEARRKELANGLVNGQVNGYTNGYTNGYVNGDGHGDHATNGIDAIDHDTVMGTD